jgi:cobaltochelatase CobN
MFSFISMKGGENIKKLGNKLLFILMISLMLILSLNVISAEDNSTLLASSVDSLDVLGASNAINVHVRDSYVAENNTWTEDGVNLANANVSVYDSSNKLIFSGLTDSEGNVVISNLNSAKYSVEIKYSTYEPYTQSADLSTQNTLAIDYMFIPDILLLVDYSSHNEKVDLLMEMSKRIAYISTMDYDVTREWLFDYAKFIHLDMFNEGSYHKLTGEYLKEVLETSPANINYNVAYTFGVYSDSVLNGTGIHIVGASAANNTFHTIENTYVGSYFQAEDIEDSEILDKNMVNYLKYVYYLINPSKYQNPTLDVNNAPLMSPECGFYHPDLGVYTIVPEAELINQWILDNPGYDADGHGSLNWMVENYPDWLVNVLDPTILFRQFEDDFIGNITYEKPFIAIATYYCGGGVVDALIRSYEAQGRPAFNIFKTGTIPPMSSLLNQITKVSKVGISAITSLYDWSLFYANGTAKGDLEDINLAVLKGVYDISETSYLNELGPQIEWTFSVTYPSFEGVYGPVILSYVDGMGKSHVIQTGVDKMVKLACQWADLKDLDNSQKTIAITLYNYPPGKAEIGASYLDVFQSTYDLLFQLNDAGFDVGDISDIPSLYNLTEMIVDFGNKGRWAQGLLNDYVEEHFDELMAHNQLIDLNQFYELTANINPDLYEWMINRWGDGLGGIMVYNDTYIVIPGMWFGKVFITFQPSRGWEEVENYHDLSLPPHQQYVAFYEWLDQTVDVDAIINMGTHGTLEWLPGRNIGVMDGDWAFELTLNPTIYPYIVSNPGEAMVARDRIAALMITHMTPAMGSDGLYGNYTKLSEYIAHYRDQIKLNVSTNAEEYKDLIIELAPSLGFAKYNGTDENGTNQSFDEYVAVLHSYLESMEDDFYTYGLHTLGKILTGDELIKEVITVTTSQTSIYNHIMTHFFPELKNLSFYDDVRHREEYSVVQSVVMSFLEEYVTALVCGTSVEDLNKEYDIPVGSALYNDTLFAASVIVNIENNNEWDAIIGALQGDYLLAGLFADPSYGDSIPVGYDGYASDSTKMPSKSAYASAVKIVDLLLADYMEEHGEWPKLVALILWGTEISRTEGIGIAEFMYFLGCTPVWSENGKVIGVELLPLEDLTVKLHNGSVVNRPRVDVFASIVTSNKDWLTWLLTSVNLAMNAENEDFTQNYVKMHYAQNGIKDRLFGLPGAILEGTGMSNLIPNTADWNIESIAEVATSVYLDKVSFAWNMDDKGNIIVTSQKEAYKTLLSQVDLITQNFDSTWRLFDSDDYYDWFGGLYNAARTLGASPDTAFVDIRNQNNYVSRSFMEEFNFEIRTMLTNPNYNGPLFRSQAGSLALAMAFQNMYGSLIMSGEKMDTQLGNQLADVTFRQLSYVESTAQAASFQSNAAWLLYMYDQGLWDASPETIQKLADAMIETAIKYGVACCHHTCKNLDFNKMLIQASSLSPEKKAEYAKILAQATLTNPLYVAEDAPVDGDGQSEVTPSSEEIMVNGTSDNNGQSAGQAGGETPVGDQPATSQNDASASASAQSSSDSSSSDTSPSEDASQSSDSKAYEVSKSAPAQSSSVESSMPIFVIVAIIILIAIFLVGYTRNRDDFDDY